MSELSESSSSEIVVKPEIVIAQVIAPDEQQTKPETILKEETKDLVTEKPQKKKKNKNKSTSRKGKEKKRKRKEEKEEEEKQTKKSKKRSSAQPPAKRRKTVEKHFTGVFISNVKNIDDSNSIASLSICQFDNGCQLKPAEDIEFNHLQSFLLNSVLKK